MASKARGHFVWHELLTPDSRSGAAFYGKVAGWTSKPWGQDPSYLVLSAGPAPMAGADSLSPDAKKQGEGPRWLPYIGTEDVEVAAWESQRLGGKVIKDTESAPTIGKFAILADPYGAVFAAIQPEYEPSLKYPVAFGDFSWHELVTRDVAGAFRFYSALFGWEKTGSVDSPDGFYQEFGWGKRHLGGVYKKPREDQGPNRWRSYIKVRDIRSAADAVTRGGGRILAGPMVVPGGTSIVMALDPQGAEFALHAASTKKKRTATRKAAPKKRATAKKKATKKRSRR